MENTDGRNGRWGLADNEFATNERVRMRAGAVGVESLAFGGNDMETKLAMPMVQIELPAVLLRRADLQTVSGARELITFLLEKYAQELEQSRRRQAYAAYYASRTPAEEAEELALLHDFAVADVAITDEEVL